MAGEIVRCPSGLQGEIRGLTGAEARMLSDRQALRSGLFLDRLLSACWLNTVEPGPYQAGADGKLDWSKVLVGDRFYLFLMIRTQTFGKDFDIKVQCVNPSCRQQFDHSVDITELPVRELSEEDQTAFKEGNRISGTLPDGTNFSFRLATGADETKAARLGAGAVTSFIGPMVAKIYAIDGVEENEKRKFFEQGGLGLAFDALNEMDTHDCGVETKIVVECPHCYQIVETDIPFGKGFLAPHLTRKK